MDHLQVIPSTHSQALSFQQFAVGIEPLQALGQLGFDPHHGCTHSFFASHVVSRRENQDLGRCTEGFARNRVNHTDAIDGVAEHLDSCDGGFISRLQFDGVASHPKISTAKCHVVAFVLQVHQPTQNTLLVVLNTLMQLEQIALVLLGIAHAVNTAHRCHHDHITTSEQCFGGRVAEPIDFVVDRRVFFNEGVTRRNVRLGLVVVVVADEILHPIVREELLHLLR